MTVMQIPGTYLDIRGKWVKLIFFHSKYEHSFLSQESFDFCSVTEYTTQKTDYSVSLFTKVCFAIVC